jgi:glyoxylase-like metal-dependent hydrolase (beta-lactamase superfamily II)
MAQNRCRLVEIEQELAGLDHFIGSWVYRDDITFVVDVGPAQSGGRFIGTLEAMGIDRVDYVLLTHIHLDHGGALAVVVERFPEARAVCHDRAVEHLVDPTKLWEGSLAVLKDRAEAFGRPGGVRRDRLIPHTDAHIEGLQIVETPGHAPHHISFVYQGCLFAGEAAGNYYVVDGADYLRPATPPRFFFETFLNSVDRLFALEDQRICYAHFGDASSSHEMLGRFRLQIHRWRRIVEQEMAAGTEDLQGRCVYALLKKDPELKMFDRLSPQAQNRERYFMTNSVKGFLGCLKEKAG